MTRDISIRSATVADVDTLAKILATAWRETYGGILPDALVAERSDLSNQMQYWQRQFATDAGIWLGELDGTPVGLALARGTPQISEVLESKPPRDLELKLCYTLQVSHGSGLAQALIDAAIGDRPAWLWTLDGNDRAEAFYGKHGFHREDPWFTRVWGEPFGEERYTDIRLVR